MAMSKRAKDKKVRKYVNAKEWLKKQEETGYASKAYNIPKGMKMVPKFKKEEDLVWDVLPYVTTSNPEHEEGTTLFARDLYVHQNLGVNKESHCCLRKMFNKDCPVCAMANQMSQDPDTKELAKDLWPKRRQLMFIRNRKNKKDGIQLFETSYYGKGSGFGEMIQAKMDAVKNKDDHPYLRWYHLEDGCKLEIAIREDSFPTKNGPKTFYRATSIEMIERDQPLPESLVEDLPSLDDIIVEPKASLIQKLLDGTLAGTDESPKKKRSSSRDEEDDDEAGVDSEIDEENEEDETEEGEATDCPVSKGDRVKFKYKGKRLQGKVVKINEAKELIHVKVAGQENPSILGFDDETLEVIDDEETTPPAKKPTKKGGKKATAEDDDEETNEDEDEDDESSGDEGEDESDEESDESEDDDADDDESGDEEGADDEADADADADADDDDDDQQPVKRKRGGKKQPVEEDDDAADDDEPFDDEFEDEEPPAKKPAKKPRKK